MSTSRFLIYALQDPLTWEIRYVGKSTTGMLRARSLHDRSPHCGRWLRRLRRWGHIARTIVLQEFSSAQWLSEAERVWIAELRRRGCPLTNLTDGGDGTPGRVVAPSVRKAISDKQKGRVFSAETRGKMAAAARRRGVSALVAANLRRPLSPDHRAKLAAIRSGRHASLETRQRLAVAKLGSGSRGASGICGVKKHGNKWRADIGVQRGKVYLGLFDTPEEARAAVERARAYLAGATP